MFSYYKQTSAEAGQQSACFCFCFWWVEMNNSTMSVWVSTASRISLFMRVHFAWSLFAAAVVSVTRPVCLNTRLWKQIHVHHQCTLTRTLPINLMQPNRLHLCLEHYQHCFPPCSCMLPERMKRDEKVKQSVKDNETIQIYSKSDEAFCIPALCSCNWI